MKNKIKKNKKSEIFKNKNMDYTTQIPARGRFGKNRPNASARVTYDSEEWESIRVRIDDANNLEFWCEFDIPAKDILKMAACIEKNSK